MKLINIIGIVLLLSVFVLTGCSTTRSTDVVELQNMVTQKNKEIKDLKASVKDADRRARAAESEDSAAMTKLATGVALLPPGAAPGECYARVFVAPEYKTTTEQVLKHEASHRLEIIPAEYEFVEEQVLVQEASTRIEQVPAQHEWKEERVMIKPAYTSWKKGRGLIEKVDNTTGEIMCLVEVPATYKTVRTKVLAAPATTRSIEIPAKYKTVKVRKIVSPAQHRRIEIPAEYQTLSKTEQSSDAYLEWRRVLCQTNMTRDLTSRIQSALLKAGHNPGPIDGVLGRQTGTAIRAFQQEKGLPTGGLTYGTIESLGIKLGRASDLP